MNHINRIIIFIILTGTLSCQGEINPIYYNKDLQEILTEAKTQNKNICLVLYNPKDTLSQIYKERLVNKHHTIYKKSIFNFININEEKNIWYSQWLFTNSSPLTCILDSSGDLIDIIPGASNKCFEAISNILFTSPEIQDMAYFNNFHLEKQQLIPMLNEVLLAKLKLEQNQNILNEINATLKVTPYPFNLYIKILNEEKYSDKTSVVNTARELLLFEEELYYKIFPDLFAYAKAIIYPNYNPAEEPILTIENDYIVLPSTNINNKQKFNLPIKNTGHKNLILESIDLDCSCISFIDSIPKLILPDEKVNLNFEFTSNTKGKVMRNITIYSNSINPIKSIKIVCEIK